MFSVQHCFLDITKDFCSITIVDFMIHSTVLSWSFTVTSTEGMCCKYVMNIWCYQQIHGKPYCAINHNMVSMKCIVGAINNNTGCCAFTSVSLVIFIVAGLMEKVLFILVLGMPYRAINHNAVSMWCTSWFFVSPKV